MSKRSRLIIIMLAVVATTAFLIYQIAFTSLETTDSGALYGGELEVGYPSAGYLIGVKSTGGIKTCGYAVISEGVGVTAAHCVDEVREIYLGLGQFNQNNSFNLKIDSAVQKEGWISSSLRSEDFAILRFDGEDFYSQFAEVAEPTAGCLYRVVAYGRTEDPAESILKPRKSAVVCASEISSKTFRITGSTSGICFGDSGSPVYVAGTNQLVGVVASIVKDEAAGDQQCAIGNEAIVVRADANEDLINDNIQDYNPGASDISVSDVLVVEVAQDSILDKLGLGDLENLPKSQQERYLVNLLLIGVTISVLLIVLITVKPFEKDLHVEE